MTAAAHTTRRGAILMYHRIADLTHDPWALAVTPRRFEEHLHVLRACARPAALARLDRMPGDGRDPLVAITFDDGYADTLEHARPILDRCDVPATVFVTTGAIDGAREFWWDELETVLLQPGPLPAVLHLRIDGAVRTWELGESRRYDEAVCLEHRAWRADDTSDPTGRHTLYRALYPLCRHMATAERTRVMDDLWQWAGRTPAIRASHRTLSSKDVATLADGGLIDVGAHSVTHADLPSLPVGTQRAEIEQSKARLEELVGRRVTAFAYPYGAHSADTVRLVRAAGFTQACTVEAAAVVPGTDPFRLPRVAIADWDGDEFARRVGPWIR